MTLLFILIIILVIGIVVINSNFSVKEKTRDQFLKDLAKFLDGDLQPIEGKNNSYQITFQYEGYAITYEDIESIGFRGEVYKAYLKIPTKSKLVLYFVEKDPSASFKMSPIIASDIPNESVAEKTVVNLPKDLKGLGVHTNDPQQVNELFDDPKTVKTILAYKNMSARGYPSMSFRVVEGVVIVEFRSSLSFHPSLDLLKSNIPRIDDFLDELLVFVNRVNEINS